MASRCPAARVLGSRPVEIAVRRDRRRRCWSSCVLAGYLGSGAALDNFAPTFILITFWVGLVFAQRDLRRRLPRLQPVAGDRAALLPSRGPAAVPGEARPLAGRVGLLVFTWIELASGWGEDPALLVTAALGYTVLTLVAQVVFGVETWTRYGETFAVYYNLFSRISPFETRDRVVGVRPPLGGLPQPRPDARHGRADLGDDRHRHLRRAHARAGCGRTSPST